MWNRDEKGYGGGGGESSSLEVDVKTLEGQHVGTIF